jgi:uroporphyrinogen III methyltransferase/synthase
MSLTGKRVVITRAGEQADELAELLKAEGAVPVAVPTIEFHPPADLAPLERAIANLSGYGLLVFTSGNAVRFFLERARYTPGDSRFVGLKVAAVGPKTARAIADAGLSVDLLPTEANAAEELAEAILTSVRVPNLKVLFPRAQEGREVFIDALRVAGADVDLVPVYRTLPSPEGKAILSRLLAGERVDWVTFASGSAARSFFALCGIGPTSDWIHRQGVRLAAIGRVTERVLLEYGMPPAVVPPKPTLERMVAAMAGFEERKSK